MFYKRFFCQYMWVLAFVLGVPCFANDSVKFFILICSYNNAKWCEKNLESVFCQTYPDWEIYYIDACSTDGTGEIVDKYIKERGFSDKCTVVHKTVRTMASENFYYAIKDCDPQKVVVQLDGDDWLAHPEVLEKVAFAYKDPNVWMTYGSYRTDPFVHGITSLPYPEPVKRQRLFRRYRWLCYPLRTFYAALFQKIPRKDFLFQGGFMKMTHDMAFSFPILEMASQGHTRFIKDVLYIYNRSNPISDDRVGRQEQRTIERYVRTKYRYNPLEKLF